VFISLLVEILFRYLVGFWSGSADCGFISDMEADFLFGWKRGGSHQWLKFLPDHAEGFVMLHELGIHLGEFFEHIRMGHEEFPLLDESAHDMDAHFHGLRAV